MPSKSKTSDVPADNSDKSNKKTQKEKKIKIREDGKEKNRKCIHKGCHKSVIFSGYKCYQHGTDAQRILFKEKAARRAKSDKNQAMDKARKRVRRIITRTIDEDLCMETIGIKQLPFAKYIMKQWKGEMSHDNFNVKWTIGYKISPSLLWTEDNPLAGFHYSNIIVKEK